MSQEYTNLMAGIQKQLGHIHHFTESILLRLMGMIFLYFFAGILFILFTTNLQGLLYQPELFVKRVNNAQWLQPYLIPPQTTANALDDQNKHWQETVIGANQGYQLGQSIPIAGPIIGLTLGAIIGYSHSE